MDVVVGYLLLIGVASSITLIVAGLAWHYETTGNLWLAHKLEDMNLFQFVLMEARLATEGQIRPRTLVDGGIVILMLTPYFRVMVSMIYFLVVLKNWKYSVFTAVVLGVLTFSLFLR